MTEQEQLEREKYFEDKNKFAYSLYKQGKFFRKARAIIKDGDDFLVLHSPEKNIYAIAGGGIENHESAKNGCIREVFEEMGLKIKVEKLLCKIYYNKSSIYENDKFNSKCLEFYYLCTPIKKFNHKHLGISGEFVYKVELAKLTKEEFLTKVKFKTGVLDKIKDKI